jgi:hypothetical protein
MNYDSQNYARSIRNYEDDDFFEYLHKTLKAMAKDVAKIVRDGTIRFYEQKDKKVLTKDLEDCSLFRDLKTSHSPQLPPGAKSPIQAGESHGKSR